MTTATHRENGPPTSCNRCGEGPIMGFDVVDHDHGIHRVLCVDCARKEVHLEVEVSGVTGWCEEGGCAVAVEEHCGNTRPDGTDEFLCPECYVPASSMSPESKEYARALDPHAVREPIK